MTNKELVECILEVSKHVANIDGKLSFIIPKIEKLEKSHDDLKSKVISTAEALANNKDNRNFSIKLISLIVGVSGLISGLVFSILKAV